MNRAERTDLVLAALTEPPERVRAWDAARWSAFLHQSRSSGLLWRASRRLLESNPAASPWPASLETHLAGLARLMRAQRAEVNRELRLIAQALSGLGAPVIVLKGAAYLAAGLPPGDSRLFSDIDILVPREFVPQAESQLMLHGWAGSHENAYDQRYYRQWMHEIPPMQHVRRGTTLDLHHNILPLTARLKPDARHLVDKAVPLPDRPGLHVLSPPDMVLHCVTHLFMNEEMGQALRDLSDLDLLLRHFGAATSFWESLLDRASLLDLTRPLYYGLRHARKLFETPIPPAVQARSDAFAPPAALRPLMDTLWSRALRTRHPRAATRGTGAALFLLYLRGHWLRMPPWLLARHLAVKALRLHLRREGADVTAPANP